MGRNGDREDVTPEEQEADERMIEQLRRMQREEEENGT